MKSVNVDEMVIYSLTPHAAWGWETRRCISFSDAYIDMDTPAWRIMHFETITELLHVSRDAIQGESSPFSKLSVLKENRSPRVVQGGYTASRCQYGNHCDHSWGPGPSHRTWVCREAELYNRTCCSTSEGCCVVQRVPSLVQVLLGTSALRRKSSSYSRCSFQSLWSIWWQKWFSDDIPWGNHIRKFRSTEPEQTGKYHIFPWRISD